MILPLARFVVAKTLADGRVAFYFYVPGKYRRLGCPVANQPLGRDYTIACGEDGNGGRAAALNAQFDEWQDLRRGLPITGERAPIYGSIRWLFQEYRRSKAFTEKVSPRSRPDYERTMQHIEGIVTKKGDKLGDRKIRFNTAGLKLPRQRSFALSGCSALKMYWRECCGGLTTEAKNGQTQSKSCTTKPGQRSGIRCRTKTAHFFTQRPKPCWRNSLAAASR